MEEESYACTAVIRSMGISSNQTYTRFQIMAKDGTLPPDTYKKDESELLFYPLHLNYAKVFGFEKQGVHLVCDLYIEWDEAYKRYSVTLSNVEKVSLIQAKKAIRELESE